jgi:ammonia channel protein AmtB
MAPWLHWALSEVAIMNSFILCSPQHAFLGVIGLLVCGLFTAEALESSRGDTKSPTAEERTSVEGGAARNTFASADTRHYYR